jgi:uncharacterized membrane protein
MRDEYKRNAIKNISWRILATAVIMLLVFIYTGRLLFTLGIGFFEVFGKLILYYLHERVWDRINWGLDEKNTESVEVY